MGWSIFSSVSFLRIHGASSYSLSASLQFRFLFVFVYLFWHLCVFKHLFINPKCEFSVQLKGDVVVFFILEHTITYGSVFHSAKFPMPFHEKYVRNRSRPTCNYMNMNYRNLKYELVYLALIFFTATIAQISHIKVYLFYIK